jgi:hypothetical protein
LAFAALQLVTLSGVQAQGLLPQIQSDLIQCSQGDTPMTIFIDGDDNSNSLIETAADETIRQSPVVSAIECLWTMPLYKFYSCC